MYETRQVDIFQMSDQKELLSPLAAQDFWFLCDLYLQFITPINLWNKCIDLRLFSKFNINRPLASMASKTILPYISNIASNGNYELLVKISKKKKVLSSEKCYHVKIVLHCVRGQSGFFDLALTEGNMQIKFALKLSVYSLGLDI